MRIRIKAAQPFFNKKCKKSIISDFGKILSSKRLIFGPFTSRFEEAFSGYHRCKYAVAVHSCSAALEIVLRYVGVQGFEVIVPTNTFVATAFSVLRSGGKLVLCDIEPEYYGLPLKELKNKITKRTKAIIVVHIGGYMVPWLPEIKEFCNKSSIVLIEDVAHAHGAMLDGKLAGTFGLAGCFSFYPTKVMTSGVGGCILTNDGKLARFAKSLRHFGEGKNLGDIIYEGTNWIMDEFRAVLAYYQLIALSENLRKRSDIAKWYLEEFEQIEGGIYPVRIQKTQEPAYYRFLSFLGSEYKKADVLKSLREDYGIEGGSLYDPPVHCQPYFSKNFRYKSKDFCVAEKALARQIAFPMHAELTRKDIHYIARALKEILK